MPDHKVQTRMFLPSVYDYTLWALFTPAILLIGRKLVNDGNSWMRKIFIVFIMGIAVVLMHSFIVESIVYFSGVSPPCCTTLNHLLFQHILSGLSVKLLVFFAILGGGYAIDYYQQSQHSKLEISRLQAQLIQSKLDTLKMQLHPHFLFNTLNTISANVERNPADSRRMISHLSQLLRLALQKKDEQEVMLDQELEFLTTYLEIEKLRFQERLKTKLDVQDTARRALVPNMLLQPIVENAIRHGVSKYVNGGEVKIRAAKQNGRLELCVEDNGPGLTNRTSGRNNRGLGLENTRLRLTELYGTDYLLELHNLEEGGLLVRIAIPFRTAEGQSEKKDNYRHC
ncbi:histidine kinase [candidate division KSB1 bacterium]|nr:histidine kinase [candidate division KSB1 bacterium]NIV69430.1 histidine kinase [Phycisphaerae bacterium]NIR70728.1 histidine kinase [candidate division KSB1 bacterium]NIS27785.1 histidine kinase [candidate division KSB1 bacterium]NIT74633.1 histidine kinase [candidate division KSB1 bacterium]